MQLSIQQIPSYKHCVWRDLLFLSLLSCRRSDEHGLDVVAFRIVHEGGIVGRTVVRARSGLAVVGAVAVIPAR